jgi:hypothetical protein
MVVLILHAYVSLQTDCLIVSFYSQTRVQLRLLRYNLEHLADIEEQDHRQDVAVNDTSLPYVDSDKMKMQLVQCIDHYQLIVWWVL